ncbi:MAG: lytic transglycosylase domain-containing protein [Comamonadaceae bacterium]|jgi:soluble lytic murein transglycosylase|nr:lytic transglycosylase domain-containing protein [Comamonadaceae bacterium]
MLTKFFLGACLLTAAMLAQSATAQSAAPALSAADQALHDARQAFERGDKARLQAIMPQVRGHLLEPWAAYWDMRLRLAEATPAQIREFLNRWAGSYQEDRLRNDWLLLLGQRRDWVTFQTELPAYRMNDDPEVRCYALWVEHLRTPGAGSARLAQEVRRLWHAQREADDGCKSAARQLHEDRQLPALEVWRKARLAMEANRPRMVRDAVEMVAPDAASLLAQIQSDPARFLRDKSLAITRQRKELITLALIRLSGSDGQGAAEQLSKKWGPQLTAEERNWVWGSIARRSAMRLEREAMDYYAQVSRDGDLSDDMLAWKVRAALRAGNEPQWPQVLAATAAMSEAASKDPTWVYWRAKALMATAPAVPIAGAGAPASPALHAGPLSSAPGSTAGATSPQRAQALVLLQSIASVRGFYEQLALEELGQRIALPGKPAPLTPQEREAAAQNPGLQRALHAIAIGLRSDGVREWNYSISLHRPGGLNDRELLAAAQLACDRAVWDRCINTSERTRGEIDIDQRFPTPMRETLLKRTREVGLDAAYVYGLIRQESRFIMDARSHVGAAGLMQIMPATARETARHIGLNGFTPNQINDRDVNITIGTAYLKRALDDFGGSMALAAAAYNAGPGRPRAWRNGPVLDAAIWAENVPFNETRDYVKKVLSNATVYSAVLTGQPQSLRARLGTVGPREAGAAPIDTKMP